MPRRVRVFYMSVGIVLYDNMKINSSCRRFSLNMYSSRSHKSELYKDLVGYFKQKAHGVTKQ